MPFISSGAGARERKRRIAAQRQAGLQDAPSLRRRPGPACARRPEPEAPAPGSLGPCPPFPLGSQGGWSRDAGRFSPAPDPALCPRPRGPSRMCESFPQGLIARSCNTARWSSEPLVSHSSVKPSHLNPEWGSVFHQDSVTSKRTHTCPSPNVFVPTPKRWVQPHVIATFKHGHFS